MKITITGEVLAVSAVQVFSAKFKKRTTVIKTGNNEYQVTLANEKSELLNVDDIGSVATAECHLDGRRWEKDGNIRWFLSLNAFKVEVSKPVAEDPKQEEVTNEELPF